MMVTSEETIKSLQNEVLRLKLIVHNQERMLDQMGRPPGQEMDETKRDLIADLMITNDELRKQIQEMEEKGDQPPEAPPEAQAPVKPPERPRMIDATCQTNLDRMNIDQLIEASLTLKRQKRQQLQQQQQYRQMQQQRHKQHLDQHRPPHTNCSQHHNHHHYDELNPEPHQHQAQQQFSQPLQQQQRQYSQPLYQNLEQQHRQQTQTLPKEYQTLSSKHMTLDEKESLDKLFKLDGLLTTARDRLRSVAFN